MAEKQRNNPVQIRVFDRAEEWEHCSKDLRILYMLEGQTEICSERHQITMKPEDLCLMNAGEDYAFSAAAAVFYAEISFAYRDLGAEMGASNLVFQCDPTMEDSKYYQELRALIRALLRQHLKQKTGTDGLRYHALCYQIMYVLTGNFQVSSGVEELSGGSEKYAERFRQINRYVQLNYDRHISMQELSEQLYLSAGYLSRFFKANFGMNFTEYLTKIRLRHAVEELLHTKNSVTAIAFDNGFSNTAAFNKAFREEYQTTPSAFRSAHSVVKKASVEEAELSRHLADVLGDEVPESYLWNATDQEKGVICGTEGEPLVRCWNQMINVGSAEELLNAEVREHIVLLKSAFNFEYVRFWSPFTKAMLIDADNADGNYNFSRLDFILDFLTEQGLKVHIELYPKAFVLKKNTEETIYFEKPGFPNSVEKLERLTDAFLRHILRRYTREVVGKWRIELSYDYDYIWKNEEQLERYLDFLACVYHTVKRHCPELMVGGSILLAYNYENDRYDYPVRFYEAWSRRKERVDFVAAVCFPYYINQSEEQNRVDKDIDTGYALRCIESLQGKLRMFELNTGTFYIDEWGLSITDRNYMNDSCFKGAYIVKNYIDLYGKIDTMAYYQGSDRASLYYDTDVLLFGGNGLISKDGVMKPAGFAFDFLNRLYPIFLGKGEHFLATTDGRGSYGIICQNCMELNYNYQVVDEDKVDKAHLSKYFERETDLELNIRIQDVSDGSYQMKIYRVNEQYGSALDLWGQMEYEPNLSRRDIQYFRGVCEPNLSIRNQETENGCLDVKIQMRPNEIAFVRLIRRTESSGILHYPEWRDGCRNAK